MVDYLQSAALEFPSVSLVPITRKGLQTEGEYLSARLTVPLMDGEEKTYRLYLGKKSEFGDTTRLSSFSKLQYAISEQLKRKLDSEKNEEKDKQKKSKK
jgi:hypothetical protein